MTADNRAGPEEQIHNWLLEPATRVKDLVKEAAYVGVVPRALIIASGFRTYLLIARQRFIDEGKSLDGFDALLAEQDSIEFATNHLLEEKGDEVPLVNAHSVVNLWTLLETMVEDTFVLAVTRDDRALARALKTGIRWRGSDSLETISEEEARDIYVRVERQSARKSDTNSSERLPRALRSIGIDLQLRQDTADAISDLCTTRNCILHRGSIIDARTTRDMRTAKVVEGERLRIVRERWESFYDAIGSFASSLLKAVSESAYCRWRHPETGEVLSGTEVDWESVRKNR